MKSKSFFEEFRRLLHKYDVMIEIEGMHKLNFYLEDCEKTQINIEIALTHRDLNKCPTTHHNGPSRALKKS